MFLSVEKYRKRGVSAETKKNKRGGYKESVRYKKGANEERSANRADKFKDN